MEAEFVQVDLPLVARWVAKGPPSPLVVRCVPEMPSKACFAVGGTLCWE